MQGDERGLHPACNHNAPRGTPASMHQNAVHVGYGNRVWVPDVDFNIRFVVLGVFMLDIRCAG